MTTTDTKVCKHCQAELPLDAFGAKQARCKSCISAARAEAKAATPVTDEVDTAIDTAIDNEISETLTELAGLDALDKAIQAETEDEAPKPRRARRNARPTGTPDEIMVATYGKAADGHKVCETHGPITEANENISRAYARRGAIICRLCENARHKGA